MAKALLIAGGVLNMLFFALHVSMFYGLSHSALSSELRGLLEAFNLAGSMTILFFAWVSFFNRRELIESRLGRTVVVLTALYYLARASEEFYWFPFTHAIFWSCLLTGAIYTVVLVMSLRKRAGVEERKPAAVAVA